jgi:hypothetical protein
MTFACISPLRGVSRGCEDNSIVCSWGGPCRECIPCLDGEAHEHGDLVLTIEFDVGTGGWIIGLTSPPLYWSNEERVHSQILMRLAAYENHEVDEYLDCLLAIHFERLGLLTTGW